MKRFNRLKALNRLELKHKWRRFFKYIYIVIPCLLCCVLGIYFAYSKFFMSKEEVVMKTTVDDFKTGDLIIGVYLDGKYSSDFPSEDSTYIVEKTECDNGAIGVWDDNTRNLNVSNISKRTKCSVYFKDVSIIDRITSSLDTTGKCPTVNSDGTVNVTGVETGNGYVCSAPDESGTSYYFRGNVTNNYVLFGGFYWRILRVNGDGSIRLIYDGTSAHSNGDASSDRMIGSSKYNSSSSDNAYVGYMYGATGAANYDDTHANVNNSTIKAYVDSWYEANLSNYSIYLSDNVFCNDRKISTYSDSTHSNKGYAKNGTYYRWARGPWDGSKYGNVNITLSCPQKNDAFTVSDTTKGNGALTYPIGLISADEATLAGTWNSENKSYYLYTGSQYWTLSAGSHSVSISGNRLISDDGSSPNFGIATNSAGVKPIINLKAGSLKYGLGTKERPYRVQ